MTSHIINHFYQNPQQCYKFHLSKENLDQCIQGLHNFNQDIANAPAQLAMYKAMNEYHAIFFILMLIPMMMACSMLALRFLKGFKSIFLSIFFYAILPYILWVLYCIFGLVISGEFSKIVWIILMGWLFMFSQLQETYFAFFAWELLIAVSFLCVLLNKMYREPIQKMHLLFIVFISIALGTLSFYLTSKTGYKFPN